MGETVGLVSLDAVGGISGDMFCACLLDARPDLEERVIGAVATMALGPDVAPGVEAAEDAGLTGARFRVFAGAAPPHHHHHVHWREIRAGLDRAPLEQGVRRHALGIFGLLAEAEAAIHGVDPEEVAFHEVGAVDSIVDILAAAVLIDALGGCGWQVGPLPRGAGMVQTQHGMLPVPAPATARLLRGFELLDDGIAGERVTPTGAAILAWLQPQQRPDGLPRRLLATGSGFGTRRLPGRANLLRALLFAPAEGAAEPLVQDTVSQLRFEIDDQTGEDLAQGLEALRRVGGVLDVSCWSVTGKKGRLATAVQLLARPAAEAAAVTAAFTETTTLGIRVTRATRATLQRSEVATAGGPVKIALRPGGARTAKLEADTVAGMAGAGARARARSRAERMALGDGAPDGGPLEEGPDDAHT